ncbi:MAG TPA: sigma 54-interacting transcriptional regulator [Syntrophales bacterium]|nr:sigma 54-interacting transcriptional regulator [Syntrophales bacterium]
MVSKESILLQEKVRLYEAVLNNILSGVLITDPDGYVIFFSETYGKFLGMNHQEKIGRHCTEVIENTRMHIVAQTGIPEINHPHRIMDHDMVVQRLPIWIDGKLVAVFGQVIFEDVKDVSVLASKLSLLETKVELFQKELVNLRSSRYSINNIQGKSKIITELKRLALKAATVNSTVLLMGESGTGKELFAHAIHDASMRRLNPFIRINCAAIPRDLLEAELFGYEPGAFTGATRPKPGKFEVAHRGTLFLDEISELPLEMQPKLLRVLEDKEVERLGGTRITKCDFRLIAATHEDLEELVRQGEFREDLYYRLNVIPLKIPPLRERKGDISILAKNILETLATDLGRTATHISDEVLKTFENYNWPGNIRELSNILERTLYSMEGLEDTIKMEHLPVVFQTQSESAPKLQGSSWRNIKDVSEKQALLQALHAANNNKQKAAQILGIHRTALYKKMKKFNFS